MSGQPVWLVVGLGNPGAQYARTRHNVGFMAVDLLGRQHPGGSERRRFDAILTEIATPAGRLVLVKPQTFMNRSGLAVAPAARWYKVPPERILVIHDELDIPFGQIRLRPGGSSAGHNGISSIIQQLGTEAFARLRIGIDRPARGATISYVLSRFTPDEARRLPEVLRRSAEAADVWQGDGIDVAMNQFNRRAAAEAAGQANTKDA